MAYYLVLSKPPEGVSEEDYNRWFDGHVAHILELPGFVAAQRLEMHFKRGTIDPPPFTYLCLYEIEGDFDAAMQALRSAVDGGQMHFEEWMPRHVSGGWECRELGGRVVAADA